MNHTTDHYIKRTIEPVMRKAVDEFPVVVVTGPRHQAKQPFLNIYTQKNIVMFL